MTVVDASVWVGWLIPEDANHAASRAWLIDAVRRGAMLAIPNIALVELAAGVARRTGRPELGHRAVQLVLAVPNLNVAAVDHTLALTAAACASDLMLRGADALYIALAHRLDAALVTWDQEQRKRGSRLVSVSRPGAGTPS